MPRRRQPLWVWFLVAGLVLVFAFPVVWILWLNYHARVGDPIDVAGIRQRAAFVLPPGAKVLAARNYWVHGDALYVKVQVTTEGVAHILRNLPKYPSGSPPELRRYDKGAPSKENTDAYYDYQSAREFEAQGVVMKARPGMRWWAKEVSERFIYSHDRYPVSRPDGQVDEVYWSLLINFDHANNATAYLVWVRPD
jgi:hypothetical protein